MYFAKGGRRSAGRRVLLGLLGTLVVLAVVVVGAMALRGPEIARRIIAAAAAQAGIAELQLDVRSIGFAGMTLGEIRLGDPGGPAASAIEIGWTPGGLVRGRLGRVRVDGLAIGLALEQGAPVIAGLPRRQAGGGMVALPVERIDLRGARIAMTVGATRIDATLDATVSPVGGDAVAGTATIDAVVSAGQAEPVRVTAKLPDWRVTDSGSGLQFAIADAQLAMPEYDVTLSAVEARIRTGEDMSARLSGMLRDDATPARVMPLAVVVEAQGKPGQIAFNGRASSAQSEIVATFDGRHGPNGGGAVNVVLAPITFAAEGRQPSELFPVVGDMVRRVEGSISARGVVSWGNAIASSGSLTINDVGFEAGAARVSDLGGTARLISLLPPRTAPAQRIAGNIHVAGLPPLPLDLRFGMPAQDRLVIEQATLGFADGTLGLTNATIAAGKPVDAAFDIRDVNLGAVLELLDIDGLSGSGKIEGRVPIRLDAGGRVALESGRLAGTVPGVLRYAGTALPEPATDAPATDPVRLMRAALADFHYTELRLTLERAASGEGSLLINLKGANPQVLDNHPFVLNIRLDTNFDRIAAILLEGYAAADALMRRRMRP
jgi:hypothetical protein